MAENTFGNPLLSPKTVIFPKREGLFFRGGGHVIAFQINAAVPQSFPNPAVKLCLCFRFEMVKGLERYGGIKRFPAKVY